MQRYTLQFSDHDMGHPNLGWMNTAGMSLGDQDIFFVKFLEARGFYGVKVFTNGIVEVKGREWINPRENDVVMAAKTRIEEVMRRVSNRVPNVRGSDLMNVLYRMQDVGLLLPEEIGWIRESVDSIVSRERSGLS